MNLDNVATEREMDEDALQKIIRLLVERGVMADLGMPPETVYFERLPDALRALLARLEYVHPAPSGEEPLLAFEALLHIVVLLRRANAYWPDYESEGCEKIIPAIQSLIDRV